MKVAIAKIQTSPGWTRRDESTQLKLQASLRKYGQVRPVVVRRNEGAAMVVVDGRQLLQAMKDLDWTQCDVSDLGELSQRDALLAMLSLQATFEIAFPAMAADVAALIAAGESVQALASVSMFPKDRIEHMATLARFDWSQFSEQKVGQSQIDWHAEPDAEHAEAPATALAPIAEPEPATVQAIEEVLKHDEPAVVVAAVAAAVRRKAKRDPGPSLFDLLEPDVR